MTSGHRTRAHQHRNEGLRDGYYYHDPWRCNLVEYRNLVGPKEWNIERWIVALDQKGQAHNVELQLFVKEDTNVIFLPVQPTEAQKLEKWNAIKAHCFRNGQSHSWWIISSRGCAF